MDKLVLKMVSNEFENMKNFKYFCDKYLGVTLYDYQRELSTIVDGNNLVWLKKSRQMGATSFIIWKIVHDIITSESMPNNITIVYVGHNNDMCSYVKTKVLELVEKVGGTIEYDNKYSCSFANGVNFKCITSYTHGRGYGINYLYIDEITHCHDIDKFFTDVIPGVSGRNKKRIFITSDNYSYSNKKEIINEYIKQFELVFWSWCKGNNKYIDYVINFRKQYGFNAFMREYEMGD